MGNFYVNYTLKGPTPQAVADALTGRSALVTPTHSGCVVVFDEQSDDQDQAVISELASQLSHALRCAALAALNHDDDIFWYQLYQSGALTDEYNSSPGYFDASAESFEPSGGDARKLCAAFGSGAIEQVQGILHGSAADEDSYAFAIERHTALVRALGISSFAVGGGFRYASDGELPEGLAEEDLLKT